MYKTTSVALLYTFVSTYPLGGPGEYEVVQCGSAGHNIRSQPNMNGAPVSHLTLKDTFTATEEVNLFVYCVLVYNTTLYIQTL